MKQKISNHVKSVILMLFIITVAMIYKFNLFNFDITYPIAYSGGDDLSMLVDAKMFSEQGWIMTTDRLGAPNGTQMYDFSANYLHNAGMVIMKIFVFLAGGNAVVGFNLTYLSIFIFAGIVSYIVCHHLCLQEVWDIWCLQRLILCLYHSFYAFIFLKEKKCLSLISSSLKDQSIML